MRNIQLVEPNIDGVSKAGSFKIVRNIQLVEPGSIDGVSEADPARS